MSSLPVALPYGMRDCKIYPYTDALGTTLGSVGYDLPNMQTFSFAEAEEYTDLRGDDSLIATHGNGAQVNWSLEAGGISLVVWAILSGGQVIETGSAPNRVITLRKLSDDSRPYFRVDGQIISDSGGDIHAVVYRAKCNGDISGQFGDGSFFVTAADGVGLPLPDTKLLYDIVQYETRTDLQTANVVNPVLPPRATSVIVTNILTTTLTLDWEDVLGATEYVVQKSTDSGQNWTATTPTGTTGTNEVQTVTITGTPTGGTFQLTFDGETTSGIAYNANSAAVQTALLALNAFDTNDVTVGGGPGPGTPYTVTFGGKYAARNVDQMTTVSALTGGSTPAVAVTTTTPGVAPASTVGLTGLTLATSYLFRLASKVGTTTSAYSAAVGPIVTASS